MRCDVITVGLCYDILIGRRGILFAFDGDFTALWLGQVVKDITEVAHVTWTVYLNISVLSLACQAGARPCQQKRSQTAGKCADTGI